MAEIKPPTQVPHYNRGRTYIAPSSGETPEAASCKCSHSTDDHDAGECWAEVDGDQCSCIWFEPAIPEDSAPPCTCITTNPHAVNCRYRFWKLTHGEQP